MEILFFLILTILYKYIANLTIYQCSRYTGMPDQCLNKWIDSYGNTRMDLWKCPTNKYCQVLSRKDDNSIGVCTYNYKKLYDQDACSFHAECASFNCDKNCIGKNIDEFCQQGLFQCKNNLACRKIKEFYPYKEIREFYKCANLSKVNETCENDNECDIRLVCLNKKVIETINDTNINSLDELNNSYSKYFDNYISIKNDSKYNICIQRASLDNGLPASNPMACKSGDTMDIELFPNYTESLCISKKEIIKDCNEYNVCVIKANLGKFGDIEIEQNCIFTIRGNPLCPLNQKELAWKNYLSIYEEYYYKSGVEQKRNSSIHIPAYKDTFNILEVSQAYWYYTEWLYSIGSDSCTRDFFFLRNIGIILKCSHLYIFIISLLL